MKEYKIVCDIEYPDGRKYTRTAPILETGTRYYTVFNTYNDADKALKWVMESGHNYKPYSIKEPKQSNYIIVWREVGEWTIEAETAYGPSVGTAQQG